MTLFYFALGLFIAVAYPTLFWPIAMVLLVIDLEENKR